MKLSVFTTTLIMASFASAQTSLVQQLRQLETEEDTNLHDETRNAEGFNEE